MRVIGKDMLDGIAGGETAQDMLDRDPSAGNHGFAHHNLGITSDPGMAHVESSF
jgi:hypothetical protein